MLTLKRAELLVDLNPVQFRHIVAALSEQGFEGALVAAEHAICRSLNLPPDTRLRTQLPLSRLYGHAEMRFGEIFHKGGRLAYVRDVIEDDLLYSINPRSSRSATPSKAKLEIGIIGHIDDTEVSSAFVQFADILQRAITSVASDGAELQLSVNLAALDDDADPRSAFRRMTSGREPRLQPAEFTDTEVRAAECLADKSILDLAVRISQSKAVPESEVARAISESRIDKSQFDSLVEMGFFVKTRVIECKQSSALIVSLGPDQGSSKALKGIESLICPKCGKRLVDERVAFLFDLGELGRKLVQKSHWLTVLTTLKLMDAGLNRESILWNIEEGADEVDILASFRDQIWVFELKAREFGAGDAHKFSFRRSRLTISKSFIVTTEQVSSDAKDVFKEVREQSRETRGEYSAVGEPIYIEGLNSLRSKLLAEAEASSVEIGRRALAPFDRTFGYSISSVIEQIRRVSPKAIDDVSPGGNDQALNAKGREVKRKLQKRKNDLPSEASQSGARSNE